MKGEWWQPIHADDAKMAQLRREALDIARAFGGGEQAAMMAGLVYVGDAIRNLTAVLVAIEADRAEREAEP